MRVASASGTSSDGTPSESEFSNRASASDGRIGPGKRRTYIVLDEGLDRRIDPCIGVHSLDGRHVVATLMAHHQRQPFVLKPCGEIGSRICEKTLTTGPACNGHFPAATQEKVASHQPVQTLAAPEHPLSPRGARGTPQPFLRTPPLPGAQHARESDSRCRVRHWARVHRGHESQRACREQCAGRPMSSRTDCEPSAVLREEATRSHDAEARAADSDQLLQCIGTSDSRAWNVVPRIARVRDERMAPTLPSCEEADIHRPRNTAVGPARPRGQASRDPQCLPQRSQGDDGS